MSMERRMHNAHCTMEYCVVHYRTPLPNQNSFKFIYIDENWSRYVCVSVSGRNIANYNIKDMKLIYWPKPLLLWYMLEFCGKMLSIEEFCCYFWNKSHYSSGCKATLKHWQISYLNCNACVCVHFDISQISGILQHETWNIDQLVFVSHSSAQSRWSHSIQKTRNKTILFSIEQNWSIPLRACSCIAIRFCLSKLYLIQFIGRKKLRKKNCAFKAFLGENLFWVCQMETNITLKLNISKGPLCDHRRLFN